MKIQRALFVAACALACASLAHADGRVITNADLPSTPSVSIVGTLTIDGQPATDRDLPMTVDAPVQPRPTARSSARVEGPSVVTISGDRRSLADGWQPPGAGINSDVPRSTRVFAYVLAPAALGRPASQ